MSPRILGAEYNKATGCLSVAYPGEADRELERRIQTAVGQIAWNYQTACHVPEFGDWITVLVFDIPDYGVCDAKQRIAAALAREAA